MRNGPAPSENGFDANASRSRRRTYAREDSSATGSTTNSTRPVPCRPTASAWLSAYQQELSERTGIPTLKVGYNKVFGYYIEVTHTHADRVPMEFNRKQTLKNAERYITAELKEYEDKVTGAERRAIEREPPSRRPLP